MTSRKKFEDWISVFPYERSTEKWPDEPENFAWPGAYKDITTDLAWKAWQEAAKDSAPSKPENETLKR